MKKAARRTTNKKSEAENQIQTSGEVFDDAMIELVTTGSANGHKPALLFWDGEKAVVKPQVVYGGRIYQPVELHPSLQQAIRLPRGAASYGSPPQLFAGVASLFERYVGFSKAEAAAITFWNASTWFADCLWSPLPLVVSGPDMDQAIRLFLLLHCLSHHPLLLAGTSWSAIRSLPMFLRPTLIINQPELPPKTWALWCASNYRGLFVPGKGGTVLDIACSKAVYSGMEGVADSWSDTALHLPLPPGQRELPRLDEGELAEIANRWQPRFLMYRLRHSRRVRESCSAAAQAKFPTNEIARTLAIFSQAEPEVAESVALLLQRREQDALARRSCDVNAVIVEVIWDPSHKEKEITVGRVTELTNELLRYRGETLVYIEGEIGWKLKNLGFYRHRNGQGMALRFSREHRFRIHQLARYFALKLRAVTDCPDCASPEVAAVP